MLTQEPADDAMPDLERVTLFMDAKDYIAKQTRELEAVMIPDLAKLTAGYLEETDLDYVRWCVKHGEPLLVQMVGPAGVVDATFLGFEEADSPTGYSGHSGYLLRHDNEHVRLLVLEGICPPSVAVHAPLGPRLGTSTGFAMRWDAEKGQFVYEDCHLRVSRPVE